MSLDELELSCLLHICDLLPAQSVARLQVCNTRMQTVCLDPYLWVQKLQCDFDVKLAKGSELTTNGAACQRLYKDLLQLQHRPLRFRGLSTDGGVDDNKSCYWLDNMFVPEKYSAFCSEIGQNLMCLGVLLGDDAEKPEDAERDEREFIIERCLGPMAYRSALLRENAAGPSKFDLSKVDMIALRAMMQRWSTLELRYHLDSLYMQLLLGNPIGQYLLHGVRGVERQNALMRIHQIDQALRLSTNVEDQGIAVCKDNGRLLVDTKLLQQVQRPSLLTGILEELQVSRFGEFSCPVNCAVVFIAHLEGTAHDCYGLGATAHQHFQLLRDMADHPVMKAFQDLAVAEAVEECAQETKTLPPVIARTIANGAAEVIEFDPDWRLQPGPPQGPVVRPVAWFRFLSKQQAISYRLRQRQEQERRERRDATQELEPMSGNSPSAAAASQPGSDGAGPSSYPLAPSEGPSWGPERAMSGSSSSYADADPDFDIEGDEGASEGAVEGVGDAAMEAAHDVDVQLASDDEALLDAEEGDNLAAAEMEQLLLDDDEDAEEAEDEAAMARVRTRSTAGRHTFVYPLQRRRAGNLLVVKLIECENLMEEHRDVHPAPNIDVAYCTVSGKLWQQPEGIVIDTR